MTKKSYIREALRTGDEKIIGHALEWLRDQTFEYFMHKKQDVLRPRSLYFH